jgi:predicted metalloendopeptidase
VPSHAVEMMSAFLDRRVAEALERHRVGQATRQQKQDLAAIIQLCGAAVGDLYAKRQFRLAAGQRCGEHDVRAYLTQVNAMKRVFLQLANPKALS